MLRGDGARQLPGAGGEGQEVRRLMPRQPFELQFDRRQYFQLVAEFPGIGQRPSAFDCVARDLLIGKTAQHGQWPRRVEAEPTHHSGEEGVGCQADERVGGHRQGHAGRPGGVEFADLAVLGRKLRDSHLRAICDCVLTREDRHVVPAGEIDVAVRSEQRIEPAAIIRQVLASVPNEADQQLLLVAREVRQRHSLGPLQRLQELIESSGHLAPAPDLRLQNRLVTACSDQLCPLGHTWGKMVWMATAAAYPTKTRETLPIQ
jgi:hypothetical protein